jgi:hypothetical protein
MLWSFSWLLFCQLGPASRIIVNHPCVSNRFIKPFEVAAIPNCEMPPSFHGRRLHPRRLGYSLRWNPAGACGSSCVISTGMRLRGVLGILAGILIIAGTAVIHAQTQTTDSEYIKIVTTGEIRKIDDKNKTFQFKFNLDQAPTVRPQPQTRPGGIGGRRRGGIGYPGGNRFPAPTAEDNSKEVKVFTSDATSVKDGKSDLHFSDLKKGDRVTVTAIHKGKGDDIEAIAVKRG